MSTTLKIYVHLLSEWLLSEGMPTEEELQSIAVLAFKACDAYDSVERVPVGDDNAASN